MSFIWLQISLLNIQGNSWRGLNVSEERVWWTLSQENFKSFWNNFDVVPRMIYDTKLQYEVHRLSQIFSSAPKIHFYWKCPSDTKTADFMGSIDE